MAREAIQDEFTNLKISRQRKHQLRNLRDGKCILCKRVRVKDTNFCTKHLRDKSKYQRGYTADIRKKAGRRKNTSAVLAA